MSITKPFTFVAGTKARANEVNQNFDVLYSQVNSNISAINTNANDIDTLDSNKANINGSSSQRFACADPTSPSDAVNKQSLTKAIGNSINYIDGYVISKDSGSPNDTILVTPGSCYDSTKSVVLGLANSTTKQNDSQGASTTYYIYIIGNATGSTTDILISPNSTTPSLPSGYTLYRQIGYYTTNSSSKISAIYSSSNSQVFNLNKLMPDYSTKTSVASGYVATEYCFVSNYGEQNYNGSTGMSINSVEVWHTGGGLDASQGTAWLSGLYLVKPGDTITGWGNSHKIYKYKLLEV